MVNGAGMLEFVNAMTGTCSRSDRLCRNRLGLPCKHSRRDTLISSLSATGADQSCFSKNESGAQAALPVILLTLRTDILIEPEEVRDTTPPLEGNQPLVVRTIGLLHSLIPFPAHEIDIGATFVGLQSPGSAAQPRLAALILHRNRPDRQDVIKMIDRLDGRTHLTPERHAQSRPLVMHMDHRQRCRAVVAVVHHNLLAAR